MSDMKNTGEKINNDMSERDKGSTERQKIGIGGIVKLVVESVWNGCRWVVLGLLKMMHILVNILVIGVLVGAICGIVIFVKVKPLYDSVRETEYDRLANLSGDSFELMRNTRVYGSNGELIGEVNVADYTYVSIDKVSKYIQEGYIAVEDRDFKSHMGISLKGIARAGIALLRNNGEITQGGSTITQQVVKNNLLTQEKTFERKLIEMFLAPDLEKKYTKADIMEFYVNTNFYGNRCYGVEAASQYYFGKSAKDVTISEAAMLVGMSNSPSNYNPVANEELAIEKRNQVLRVMLDVDVITQKQYDKAIDESIEVVKKREERAKETYQVNYAIYSASLSIMEKRGFEFEYTFKTREDYEVYKERYSNMYNEVADEIRNGGYDIYTSLDSEKQKELQSSVDETLKEFKEKQDNGKYVLQGAAVSIDNKTNYVVAIVGGRGEEDEFNRGYLSMRQPGSTIKPLVDYAPAFETGRYYPSLIVNDVKIEDGPSNSNGKYIGRVSVRDAIAKSINTVAYQTLQDIGVSNGMEYLSKMQFSTLSYVDNNNLSIALGGFTRGVRVIDMAKGYSTLANDGEYSSRTCIVKIEHQKDGLIVDEEEKLSQVYGEDTAWLVTDCLKGVLSNIGTGKGLGVDGQECAAKSGTTNDNKDGWFCGYSEYYTTAVWVGRDDNKSVSGMYGATYAGKIWNKYMTQAHEGLDKERFNRPRSVKQKYINSNGESVTYNSGRKDWFSIKAEEKARLEEEEKINEEIKKEMELKVKEFEEFTIAEVTDYYKVDTLYNELLKQLGKVNKEDDRIKFSKRVANKYDKLLKEKEEWKESIDLYEQAQAVKAEEEAEKRKKEEEKRKEELERSKEEKRKQVVIDGFKDIIKVVQDTEIVTEYTYTLLDKASKYLSKCTEFEEYWELKDMYEVEMKRIPELEEQNRIDEENKKQEEEEEAKNQADREEDNNNRLENEQGVVEDN